MYPKIITIIMTSYKSNANLNRFMRINNINFDVYNIKDIGLPIEKANTPYYFISDGLGYAKLLFVPRKENHSLTEKYFEIITKRFFKDKK